MSNKRTPRLERWTRRITRMSKLVRALAVLVDDVKVLLDRSRCPLVITVVILILTIRASLKLL